MERLIPSSTGFCGNYLTPSIQRLIGLAHAINSTPAIVGKIVICMYSPGQPATLSSLNSPATNPANKFPNDVARNQMPIIWPTSLRVASFVTELKPTGLKQSSPNVWTRQVVMSQVGKVLFPTATTFAAPAITTKPVASSSKP